ncbi:hypothetical protein [Nonlabens ponticola]|uniref:Uncharacterized protein n=1 Tax=Nonlabens ponticola TaxID=2496866 RepID=A0A3S9MZQ5_9FLAO|nr:hypothetical protein [Nonlabens ponticola]AZQ44647.1 hypothetical protein EJ995_10500 [Nonlabens ponticola]
MINEINYIDFEPKALEKSFWGSTTYENLEAVLSRANEWVRKNYNKEIVNVETVVLPNIYKNKQAFTDGTIQYYTGGHTVSNFQIIRIWYKG